MKQIIRLPKVYLSVVLGVIYLPILLVVIYSFNDNKLSSIWGGFSFKWYKILFQDIVLFQALCNSLVLAFLTSLCAAIIGTLGAVGIQQLQSRTKGPVEFLSTISIIIPEIILGMVFMTFFALLGLPFGMITLVIAHTAFCIPYIFMLVKGCLVGMDKNLPEAARDLGASETRVFFDITLPLIIPAIFSGMLLSFAMSLDDVIISLFVTGVDVNTLPIMIYSQLKFGITPEINALCTLMLLITILLVILSYMIVTPKEPRIFKK